MKKIIICLLALCASVSLCDSLFSQQQELRIAVFPFEDLDNVLTRNESTFFYREFSNEFTNRRVGGFPVVPRQDVEKLINTEAEFQLSYLSERAKTAEYEKVLNSTLILSGLIGRLGNRIRITVSLYTFPQLVQLPGGASISVADKNELFDKIPELVQLMQTAIGVNPPPLPTDNRPTGGTNTQAYKIGDTGPAGGIVFFDRGFTGDGWRYLEAAPVGAEFTAQWGAYNQDVANTMTAVGFGKKNTAIIVERLNQLREMNRAAQVCAALDINGYKDWFLPSKDELNLMYTNLKQKNLGGFGSGWYWSSSQGSSSSAWGQSFSDGGRYNGSKGSTYSVRAVRAF